MTPQEMGQVNKELSNLQPVIDTLAILKEQRDEVTCANSYCMHPTVMDARATHLIRMLF